jgi:peptidoglycan hydrolase-like protein with peptidoglycan-binding domain
MNGTMGTPTILALRTFQRKHKIPVTGQIDSKTKEALLITLVENA